MDSELAAVRLPRESKRFISATVMCYEISILVE